MRAVLGLLVACSGRHEPPPPPIERPVVAAIDAKLADAPARPARLSKAELRPRMKVVMRLLDRCYADALAIDPKINGVANTLLTIRNDPNTGIHLTVNGFETVGPLGKSEAFLGCVKTTLEANVLPALPAEGQLDVIYPLTFDPGGAEHHDTFVPLAVREEKEGHCAEALAAAERGLEQPWLAGPLRHTLVELAGTCACRLKDDGKARHFFALASPEFEDNIVRACSAAGIALVE